jgi:hypothetical protein
MTGSRWRYSTLVLSLALTLACNDSSGPVPATGTFVLRQVQQDLLPTVMAQSEFFVIRVLSDTIRLAEDGTGTISGVRESVPVQGGTGDGPVHIETPLHYHILGTQILMDFDCPDMATCIAGPHLIANRVGTNLTATWGPMMIGRSPLIYAEVGSP